MPLVCWFRPHYDCYKAEFLALLQTLNLTGELGTHCLIEGEPVHRNPLIRFCDLAVESCSELTGRSALVKGIYEVLVLKLILAAPGSWIH